jgi:hypothetical protein
MQKTDRKNGSVSLLAQLQPSDQIAAGASSPPPYMFTVYGLFNIYCLPTSRYEAYLSLLNVAE